MAGGNSRLDEALQRSGWTPEQLAAALNARLRATGQTQHQIHPKTPWKWIRRGERPHPPLPGYVAELLSERIGYSLTAEQLGLSSGKRATLTVPADDGLLLPYTDDDDRTIMDQVGRRGPGDSRRFAALYGPSLGQHAHLWLIAGQQEDQVRTALGPQGSTPAALAVFRTLLDQLRRLDDLDGGAVVREWAAREAGWAATAVRDRRYRPAAERDLMAIVAELAQLAGWAAIDSNRHAEAQRWHIIASHAAEAAADREFAGYVLCMLAFDATLAGQHDQAVVILDSARTGVRNRASLTVQAMLAAWHACAHAGAGDRMAFEKTLSHACRLYDRARPQQAPEWAYWMAPPAHLAETARAWTLVGDPRRAVDLLTNHATDLDTDYPRDLALRTAYLAEAHITHDPDQAARVGDQVLDAVSSTRLQSPRVLTVVRSVADRLSTIDTPTVRRFTRRTREQLDHHAS